MFASLIVAKIKAEDCFGPEIR